MIYVIMQHTGQYSDYRAHPLFYTEDEEIAKSYCEKAQEIARHLETKRSEIWEGHNWDDDDNMKDYDKRYKKQKKLKSPFDETLKPDEFSDVRYDYQPLEKWSPQ